MFAFVRGSGTGSSIHLRHRDCPTGRPKSVERPEGRSQQTNSTTGALLVTHRLSRSKRATTRTATTMPSPEQRNYAQIDRLETLLEELRANPSTARETEAIREIGLEIAVAIREVGAMLINVGWEQTFATDNREQK